MTFDFSQCIHSLFIIYQEDIIQFILGLLNPKTVPASELRVSSRMLLDNSKLLEYPKIRDSTINEDVDCAERKHDDYNIPTPPLTLSPSLSITSLSSFTSNWSLERHSKVEEMIRLFESDLPKRRYSVDSYSPQKRKTLIRQRRFDYTPIFGEWKRRELETAQPCSSKSTPVRTPKRKQSLF
ncbi:hypothetical protein K501DRAFT_288402 [Backusella circina FSU 941]|nr:hypothetical protein K501DRAFT_288402 [Backusella circina FSU 941]